MNEMKVMNERNEGRNEGIKGMKNEWNEGKELMHG
jgi:hypothetical protein